MASAASTAGIIASGVAAPLAALYVGQRSVIYPRPPVYDDAKAYGGEHAEIVRADGVVGLFVPPPKADEQIIALFFHGNADQITWGGAMIGQALRSRGIGTFAAEYPGYGLAEGAPTEESITQAAEAALRAVKDLRPEAKVALVGQSIGCAPALAVAAAHGLPVVLISPFTSLASMAATLLPFLPQRALRFLVKDKFDNAALAPRVTSPVLVLHGTRDEIVPYAMGEAMSEAIADATAKLGEARRPWVAAHLRRGDACRDGAYMGRTCSSGDDYARACCDAGRKYGFGTLIVATDSSSALAELTAALAERRCPFTVKATSDTSVDDKTRESARVEDLLESNVLDSAKEFAGVLVDVFLLASGDVYIGKFTSNLDRLAYALLVARKGVAAPYVSLDTAWSKDTPALFDAATHLSLIHI